MATFWVYHAIGNSNFMWYSRYSQFQTHRNALHPIFNHVWAVEHVITLFLLEHTTRRRRWSHLPAWRLGLAKRPRFTQDFLVMRWSYPWGIQLPLGDLVAQVPICFNTRITAARFGISQCAETRWSFCASLRVSPLPRVPRAGHERMKILADENLGTRTRIKWATALCLSGDAWVCDPCGDWVAKLHETVILAFDLLFLNVSFWTSSRRWDSLYRPSLLPSVTSTDPKTRPDKISEYMSNRMSQNLWEENR